MKVLGGFERPADAGGLSSWRPGVQPASCSPRVAKPSQASHMRARIGAMAEREHERAF